MKRFHGAAVVSEANASGCVWRVRRGRQTYTRRVPQIQDWRGRSIAVAVSSGGVLAVVDPWDNFVATGVRPWPPPELIQKIYKSRQGRAFSDAASNVTLGFYSDLQSIHSEDAITWSVFGPVIYDRREAREAFVRDLFSAIDIQASAEHANVWLWRRLPHPDTLVSGGPEIDFGIHTDDVFLLGEAKWRSPVGAAQGVNRQKDQLTLRREFCEKYGRRLLPNVRRFAIVGVSWNGGMLPRTDAEADGISLHARDVSWRQIAAIDSHPCAQEIRAYLDWKAKHSKSA